MGSHGLPISYGSDKGQGLPPIVGNELLRDFPGGDPQGIFRELLLFNRKVGESLKKCELVRGYKSTHLNSPALSLSKGGSLPGIGSVLQGTDEACS